MGQEKDFCLGAFELPGMYFELFVFLTLLIVGLILTSVFSKRIWAVLIACVFMVLLGAGLMSDGMRIEVGSTYDSSTGVITYDYNALTPANDYTIAMFAYSYFYGGFLLAVAGIAFLFMRNRGEG